MEDNKTKIDVQVNSKEYSYMTGAKKALKNVGVTFILPAILFAIENYSQWLPEGSAKTFSPFAALIAYMIKNRIEFMNKDVKL